MATISWNETTRIEYLFDLYNEYTAPLLEGKKKKKCQHCGLEVYHKPEACFELEANAAKRPVGWMSKKST